METNDLGQFIREKREEQDLSLRELARRAGISAPFLSDIELGRRHPSEDVLKRLSKELSLPFKVLQSYDARFCFEELKRMAEKNPNYGVAFRKIATNKVPPEELIKLADKLEKRKKSN